MSHMNESCHIRMSHITYVWFMSLMNESCLIFHTCISYVTYVWLVWVRGSVSMLWRAFHDMPEFVDSCLWIFVTSQWHDTCAFVHLCLFLCRAFHDTRGFVDVCVWWAGTKQGATDHSAPPRRPPPVSRLRCSALPIVARAAGGKWMWGLWGKGGGGSHGIFSVGNATRFGMCWWVCSIIVALQCMLFVCDMTHTYVF